MTAACDPAWFAGPTLFGVDVGCRGPASLSSRCIFSVKTQLSGVSVPSRMCTLGPLYLAARCVRGLGGRGVDAHCCISNAQMSLTESVLGLGENPVSAPHEVTVPFRQAPFSGQQCIPGHPRFSASG